MTLNGISSYSSSLYGTTLSPAVSGFQQVASGTSSGNSKSAATGGIGLQRPQRMDDSAQKAALAKLQETDPALAQKMEEFHQKVDDMRQSGASQDDIQTAMKSNMDSLSDTEKSELKSVFGNRPSGGPSGPGGPGGPGGPHGSKGPSDDDVNQVISSLKDTNSDLATKLQSFQDEIDQLEKSGASDDDVMAKRKEQMDSLSDTEKSQVKDAFDALHQQDSDNSVSSTSATASNSIYQQAIAAYAKSHSGLSLQLSQQGLAFAA